MYINIFKRQAFKKVSQKTFVFTEITKNYSSYYRATDKCSLFNTIPVSISGFSCAFTESSAISASLWQTH